MWKWQEAHLNLQVRWTDHMFGTSLTHHFQNRTHRCRCPPLWSCPQPSSSPGRHRVGRRLSHCTRQSYPSCPESTPQGHKRHPKHSRADSQSDNIWSSCNQTIITITLWIGKDREAWKMKTAKFISSSPVSLTDAGVLVEKLAAMYRYLFERGISFLVSTSVSARQTGRQAESLQNRKWRTGPLTQSVNPITAITTKPELVFLLLCRPGLCMVIY